VLYAGHIVEEASAERLYRGAIHPYTRTLLAAVPGNEAARRALPVLTDATSPARASEEDGCPYFPRCPSGKPGTCDVTMPEMSVASDDTNHRFACHFPESP
jgi:oligopeptide/dipeptide ABC transporter ATP-binding protein